MDDLQGLLGSLLSQPGAMEQLSQAAKQLGLDLPEGGSQSQAPMQPPAQRSGADLLQSLGPGLDPKRREKLDRAVRAMRLAASLRVMLNTLEL